MGQKSRQLHLVHLGKAVLDDRNSYVGSLTPKLACFSFSLPLFYLSFVAHLSFHSVITISYFIVVRCVIISALIMVWELV